MNEPCTRDEDLFIFDRMTLGEYIIKHVVINDDMSYKDMLLDILQIKYISDNSIIKFLEKMVNPEVRTGEEQTQYVKEINEIIGADGFELVVSGKISNELIYKIYKRQAAKSNMKNLIFAPLGKKPDIVIDDAIANDIKIVGDTDNCLLYDFEPNADGLLWNTLVKWWGSAHASENIQKDLFKRLLNSLDSQPEKDFFTQYYTIYQNANEYPALIPQVYLHYDPHARTWRGSNVVYTHQRMDFLMLLPNGIRVVIEIDGKQHYSEHYVLHQLRNDPAFVPELDFVMLLNENGKEEKLIGQNMFMRTSIKADDGRNIPIMTMGPICIKNEYKRKGYGKILLDYSLEKAAELGCGALCFEGNIDFYGKSRFKPASEYGIRYHGLPEGEDASFFLCKELVPGYLDGITGEYATPEGYLVDEREAEEFDKQFPYKEKKKLPGQIF